MLHIKDMLASIAAEELLDTRKLLREILFVAPSMRVLDLLLQMRQERIHMALVVDEYGGIDGLTTIEDLVEQIVGEIEDEHDVDEGPMLTRRADGTIDVDARLELNEFENQSPLSEQRKSAKTADDTSWRIGFQFGWPRAHEGRGHPS